MGWLTVARWIVPYLVVFGLGSVAAWTVQGVRIDALKQDVKAEKQKLVDYKTEQHQAKITAEIEAEKRRKETANEWTKKLETLRKDHDAFRRCVAAGKCGGLSKLPRGAGVRVSPAGGPDAASTDAVPAAGDAAPEVIGECARTTLMLNQLQTDIEKQLSK